MGRNKRKGEWETGWKGKGNVYGVIGRREWERKGKRKRKKKGKNEGQERGRANKTRKRCEKA